MATLARSTLAMAPSGLPTNPQAATAPMAAAAAINPYIYTPSFSIAVVGSVVFAIAGFALSAQLIRNKAWYFNLMPQAALIEAAGMIARTDSTLHVTNLTAFAVQMLATSIPASLVAIGNIFTFTRLMWWVTPSDKRTFQTIGVPTKWVSAIWASMSVACDILKSIGSNLRTNPTAQKVEMIGLILQFFVFAAFTLFSARFMWRARSWLISGEAESKYWERLGWTIVGVMGTLAVCNSKSPSLQSLTNPPQLRAIFVVIEFDGQPQLPANPAAAAAAASSPPMLSFIAIHEWPFWFFDVFPMAVAFALFICNNPGDYLPREYTRLRFKIRDIERVKSTSPWQVTISNPIQIPVEDKMETMVMGVETREP